MIRSRAPSQQSAGYRGWRPKRDHFLKPHGATRKPVPAPTLAVRRVTSTSDAAGGHPLLFPRTAKLTKAVFPLSFHKGECSSVRPRGVLIRAVPSRPSFVSPWTHGRVAANRSWALPWRSTGAHAGLWERISNAVEYWDCRTCNRRV